jgi:hypothetical protein
MLSRYHFRSSPFDWELASAPRQGPSATRAPSRHALATDNSRIRESPTNTHPRRRRTVLLRKRFWCRGIVPNFVPTLVNKTSLCLTIRHWSPRLDSSLKYLEYVLHSTASHSVAHCSSLPSSELIIRWSQVRILAGPLHSSPINCRSTTAIDKLRAAKQTF